MGALRDLHSFPTRRSSDLRLRCPHPRSGPASRRHDPSAASTERASQTTSSSDVRSEEHTSELQSHHDLVCRLLLEKKNIPSRPRHEIEIARRHRKSQIFNI